MGHEWRSYTDYFRFYKLKINIWIWLNHKVYMQVLAFYSCHGKIIISEYCKVEVHGNMAYFSALHLTGWNQGTSCWAFQKSLGENPPRSIQGFDRVQFQAVVKLRLPFWPGITVAFYRPPIINLACDSLHLHNQQQWVKFFSHSVWNLLLSHFPCP